MNGSNTSSITHTPTDTQNETTTKKRLPRHSAQHLDRSVKARRIHGLIPRAERRPRDNARVPDELSQTRARRQVPDANRAIVRGGQEDGLAGAGGGVPMHG